MFLCRMTAHFKQLQDKSMEHQLKLEVKCVGLEQCQSEVYTTLQKVNDMLCRIKHIFLWFLNKCLCSLKKVFLDVMCLQRTTYIQT